MADKTISQIVSKEGKPVAPATSAPGCFIQDGKPIPQHPDMKWGKVFSEPRSGNDVDFYVTGSEYFDALTSAIAGAKKSIYITGWQVNFDVELQPGKTMYQLLEKAIDDHPELHIYVMPWLSPKVGQDTGDFETMLAVFQLNAGLKPAGKIRAFAMPAIAQSDMTGGMGIFFSHHQKLIVIDDERAFLGGMDVAYGRRDDGRFTLAHEGRQGSEVYNTCIPPVEELTAVDQTRYLTRMEMLFACFAGAGGKAGTFWYSASGEPIAIINDGSQKVSDKRKDITHQIGEWWSTTSLMPEFVERAMDVPVDLLQDASRFAYQRLDALVKGKLDRLRSSGSAHAANAAAALLAWLNNASMDQLPSEARQGLIVLLETFMIDIMGRLAVSAAQLPKRYDNLGKLGKMLPKSGKVLSKEQPRMPWHDVQCSVMGPSVSDLSRNFSLRWNGLATRYRKSHSRVTWSSEIQQLYSLLGLPAQPPKLWIPTVPPPIPASDQRKQGKCWVQVLRSASVTMLRDEMAATGGKVAPSTPQNDCLKAMLTAIYSAQKFIYIEGQFFQVEYGTDSQAGAEASGPMAALIDITSNPHYEKHAKRLGILGVAPEDIPGSIRWSQVDDVRRDIHGRGADFMNDLHAVLGNIALIKTTQSLGRAQKHVLNPMGEALARRIESAIFDGLPFHVYMVLPVYPEGTLNTLNIMTQVHLTMQSLVFGSNSLVNRIRRAVVARQLMKKMNVSAVQAKRLADSYYGDELAEMAGNQWEAYLTLLNLRNWQTLQGRPVTEQVYVHSKILIADDRVAILGTANINDRSQLGDRDSEIAVTIRDDAQTRVKLDGKHEDPVSTSVHHFRRRLWSKLFGLMGGVSPAELLAAVIDQPAAPATWEAIQKVAQRNAAAYDAAFKFVPKVANASSIWPCWDAKRRKLVSHMPFNEQFWRAAAVRDTHFTWDAEMRGQESAPAGVKGYIVALPLRWTEYENNLSGINLSLMAANDSSTDNLYTGVDGKSDSEYVPTADSGGNLPRSTIATTSKGAT